MSKDMDLAMNAARSSGAVLPAAAAAQSVLASIVSSNGDLDLAAIRPFVISQSGQLVSHYIRTWRGHYAHQMAILTNNVICTLKAIIYGDNIAGGVE